MQPAEADVWRECPRCRHRVLRWAALQDTVPQRGLAAFDLAPYLRPERPKGGRCSKRGGGFPIWASFYLIGLLFDEVDVRLRQRKHRRLFGVARLDNWVCANYLHRESPDPPPKLDG